MLYLLQVLIFGHVHKWKEITRGKLHTEDGLGGHKNGTRVETVCEVCGAHRKWDLV